MMVNLLRQLSQKQLKTRVANSITIFSW
jgi:hypothetical protein